MQKDLTRNVLAALALGTLCFGTAVCQAETVNEDLGDVVVTAERMPSSRMSTPADVTVITSEQMESNHYQTVGEALANVNGVVVTNGNANGDSEVIINGDQRVVVLVDGQRLNNDQGSMSRATVNLGMIPSVKNIERIEVVKGAGSALYGSDAVGGVVNIITRKGTKNETTVDLNTGSFKAHNYELTNQGSAQDWSWFITAGLQKRGYFNYKSDHNSSTRMQNSDYNNKSFSLRLDKQLSANESLRLNFAHHLTNNGITTDANAKQKHNYNYGSLTWNFKEKQPVHGFLRYFANYKSTDYMGKFDTHTQGVDYQNGWKLGKNNKLVAGAEWHQSKSSNKQSGYENKKITTQALFLQDTMRLTNKWFFVPGVRVDHHDSFGTHWTPKAAVNYRADKRTKVYASWGRVFKAPTADDLFYTVEGEYMGYPYAYYGNPNLKPESGHVETVGFTHEFSRKAILDASYFWSNLHDAIRWVPEPTTGFNYATNIDLEKKHGIQVSFTGKPSEHWSYDVGYSYIDVDAKDIYNNKLYYSQPNGYRLGLHYNYGRWAANILGRMGSGLEKSKYNCNSYAIWDFNTTYAATDNVKVYFKANNITNKMYYLGSKYPLQGRSFQLGVKVSF
ncbi:TonB-dependent receptor plug domain-containing protein [Selenomonas ruminantium]|uniref:Vitamin B12 transporter n=1 Tax=Selenomonas ruminantium TaxID=971 RepID=A0A1H0S9K8_SELRU|nr:TonB-dependent receptor [Selenomonas ruminantium]SDP38444.1 vitamin B12 transporter [Selenomonas ruminantium]